MSSNDFEVMPIGTKRRIEKAKDLVLTIDIVLSQDGVVPVQILNSYKKLKQELIADVN
jgi:hypothetical protein